jgi:hypothetical protein
MQSHAESYQIRQWAEGKNSPFDFSEKYIRNVVIAMLQGQSIMLPMKLVDTQASTPIFIHWFRSMMAKCIMKMEFSRKRYTPASRYSLLNDLMAHYGKS